MLAWLLSPINTLRTLQGTNEWLPDRMDIAIDIHQIVSQKVMGSGDTRTVLQTAREILSDEGTPVTFTASRELNAAGPNSENCLVAWSGSEALEPNVPGGLVFDQRRPQEVPGTFAVVRPCRAKNGGLASWRPREAIIGAMATS
jgi:hypothetical protein